MVGDSYKARISQFGALSVIGCDKESYLYPSKLFEIRGAEGHLLKHSKDGTKRIWTMPILQSIEGMAIKCLQKYQNHEWLNQHRVLTKRKREINAEQQYAVKGKIAEEIEQLESG